MRIQIQEDGTVPSEMIEKLHSALLEALNSTSRSFLSKIGSTHGSNMAKRELEVVEMQSNVFFDLLADVFYQAHIQNKIRLRENKEEPADPPAKKRRKALSIPELLVSRLGEREASNDHVEKWSLAALYLIKKHPSISDDIFPNLIDSFQRHIERLGSKIILALKITFSAFNFDR